MYDELAEDYDRFVNWDNRLAFELPFIESSLQSAAAQKVLDAATGTGVHAIALAQRGYQAWGADLSPAMVMRAAENAANAGAPVDFQTAAFGELASAFSAQLPFDALLCLGNSLPHVKDLADLQHALADFQACLRPGGLLLLQNRNFDTVLAERQRWMEPQSFQEGGKTWIFMRFYDFEPDGMIKFNIVTMIREANGSLQQRTTTTRLFPLRQAQLTSKLEKAGFEAVEAFGGLDGSAFDITRSGNLVITARRA